MDAYVTFKNVEREINDVQREVIKFNKLYDNKLKAINFIF